MPQPPERAGPQRRRRRLGPGRARRRPAARARGPRRDRVRARRPRRRAAALRHPRLQAREGADRPPRRAARRRGRRVRLGVDVGGDVAARRAARPPRRDRARDRRAAPPALTLPGAELAGVHLAMDYLVQQNRRVAGLPVRGPRSSARGLRVAILGGGDTSADCLGNVLREGCASVVEIAHGPTPPNERNPQRPGPSGRSCCAPTRRTRRAASASGSSRPTRSRATRAACSDCARGASSFRASPRPACGAPVETGEVTLDVDLVFVAIGFTGVESDDPLYAQLGLELGARATVPVDGAFATAAAACSPPATACAAPT